ncbi:MAG: threonine ammonia-lyase [Candidatus Helarchaeota archaeon]
MPNYTAEIESTYDRIKDFCKRTPLIFSTTFSNHTNNNIFLKLENFQKTGSFKIRGAMNKIQKLDKSEVRNGIITASAGNHGQAIAYASKLMGYKSYVVVPQGTPINKMVAIESYGAEIIVAGKTYDEAYDYAMKLKDKKGLVFIPAYDDFDVIYGQGTIGLEIMEQCPDVDIIVVPVGGGGLISGIAAFCKSINPRIRIIGVQSSAFHSMYTSFKAGKIEYSPVASLTIADGIAVKRPGIKTFSIIKEMVDDIVLVNDDQIANAILLLMERAKIVVEGAGASSLAAVLNLNYFKKLREKNIVCILSGGNIDVNLINRIITKGLIESGRILKFSTELLDVPGALLEVLEILKNNDANIISIDHNRNKLDIPYKEAEVIIEVETRNQKHIERILEALKSYNIKVIK